jgi:aryl-alcohol dehydrogenase
VQAGAGAILNAMPVRPGSRVAIWGTGAVGLAAVMAAAASGADERVAGRLPAVRRVVDVRRELGEPLVLQDLLHLRARLGLRRSRQRGMLDRR